MMSVHEQSCKSKFEEAFFKIWMKYFAMNKITSRLHGCNFYKCHHYLINI